MHTSRYFKVLLFSTLTGCCFSCGKLKETSYSQVSPGEFFGTKSDVDAALVAMYNPIQQCCNGFQQAGTFVLNSASDEGTSDNSLWGQYDQLTYTPNSSPEIQGMWQAYYQSISSANFVLDNQAKIEAIDNTSDKSYTNEKLAEARFMRGMDYFFLVQLFGDVPLRTTSVTRLDQTDIARTASDSVYAQIIQDFQFAAQYLPVVADKAGKPTKYAATAFLAKVYLTRGNYQNALTNADSVISSATYSLLPSFADVFDVNNKNNEECIFSVQYIRLNGQGMRMEELVMGPNDKYCYGGGGGWGLSNLEPNIYPSYQPADSRRATTITDTSSGQATYYPGKWRDVQGVSADGHGNNYIVYRYADVLLESAEAYNEVNGPGAEAYNRINQVRSRASLPNLTPGLSQSQFRDSVLWERHLELCFEEWRWFDLKRTGRLKNTLILDGKAWDDKFLLFPIPQPEIDASNGKITQNPGY
jgi:hypothetical protein